MPKQTFFNLPAEKRQTIINLAIDEFADNDYQNASISRIVARAGIAKGSFYQYFADKKELYLYLIELALQEKAQFLQGTPPPDPQMGTFAYLRWLFETGLRFGFSNPQLTRLTYRAFYDDVPFSNETIAQAQAGSSQFFTQMIQQGIEQGDLRPDLDVDSAVFLFNLVFLELGNHIMQRLGIDPAELAEEGAQVFDETAAADIYNRFMDIFEFGMGAR